MSLSPREREILDLLRSRPTLDAAGLAEALGTSKGAIAVALSSLTAKGEITGRGYLLRESSSAIVFGGANWDIKARTLAPAIGGTSNPATITRAPGGVGRNIAENLARLGQRVQLVAGVGADADGRELVARTSEAGVDTRTVRLRAGATGSYLAALDADGELVIGLSDMVVTDTLRVADLGFGPELVGTARVVVVDGNLPAEFIGWVLAACAAAGVRVVLDPVSVAKAARLRPVLAAELPVFTIKPDRGELAALVGREVGDDTDDLVAAAAGLRALGVVNVWVSRGVRGSLLIGPDGVHETAAIPAPVADVTGAGDAMTAGFVHGLLGEAGLDDCVRYGHVAAALTVASPQTVRPDLGLAFAAALKNPQPTPPGLQGAHR